MNKRIYLIILLVVCKICGGQNFLNGSFEITTATTCEFGLSNAGFDSLMADVKGIGDYNMISLYDSSSCYNAEDGRYSINLMHSPIPPFVDAVSLKLSDSLHMGNSYSFSFYQYYFFAVMSDSIEIGVSDNDSTFGTLVAVSPMTTVPDVWIQRNITFVSPLTGNFITVRPRFFPGAAFNYLDNFTFDSTTSISNLQLPTSNFQIAPNPVANYLTITTDNNEKSEVIIYDMSLRKLLEKGFFNAITLNTEQLAKGIYYYELRSRNGLCKKGKVVKD